MTCTICKHDNDTRIITLGCKHVVCSSCLSYWLRISDTCWICKYKLSDCIYNTLSINRPTNKLTEKQIQERLIKDFCIGIMPYNLINLFLEKKELIGRQNICTAISNGVLRPNELNNVINSKYLSDKDIERLVGNGHIII